jgi:hypothetical protein
VSLAVPLALKLDLTFSQVCCGVLVWWLGVVVTRVVRMGKSSITLSQFQVTLGRLRCYFVKSWSSSGFFHSSHIPQNVCTITAGSP